MRVHIGKFGVPDDGGRVGVSEGGEFASLAGAGRWLSLLELRAVIGPR